MKSRWVRRVSRFYPNRKIRKVSAFFALKNRRFRTAISLVNFVFNGNLRLNGILVKA